MHWALECSDDIVQGLRAWQRRNDNGRLDPRNRGTGLPPIRFNAARRGARCRSLDREARLEKVGGHRRAHHAKPDDADALRHFALTRTTATMHGSLPRTLHEWFVPRCTSTSPARSSFSPVSMMA